jgi:hypothetical protein
MFVCALTAVAASPVQAATVTDVISFSDVGIFGVSFPQNAASIAHGYQGTAVASGSFTITFDPTQLYLTQSISGFISGLTYSVTDPFFSGSPLTLNPITEFAFDGAGTLTLYSNSALNKTLNNTPNITIGINGWAYGLASGVWFSQTAFDETLTTNGAVSIVETTPLPAAAWLFGSVIAGGAGIGRWRKRRKAVA